MVEQKSIQLDEESKNLMRTVLERNVYRQLMIANIRGHGQKFVNSLDEKLQLAQDLNHSLGVYREVERLHERLGGADLHSTVRVKMERIPYPVSRLELAVCLVLCDAAEQVAAESYLDSACKDYAAIAHSLRSMVREGTSSGEDLFVAFCQDKSNLPHAKQMVERWFAITIRSLGRPGTPGDARMVELGLRSRSVEASVRLFLERVVTFLDRCGLPLPNSETVGVDLPSTDRTANR